MVTSPRSCALCTVPFAAGATFFALVSVRWIRRSSSAEPSRPGHSSRSRIIRISEVLPAPQAPLMPIVRGGFVSTCWMPRAIASA